VVSLHGLKPRAAPQSPCMPPTGVCPLLRGLLQGAAYGSERPLRGDEFRTANVGSGSGARLRALEKQSPERRGPPRAKSNGRGTSHSRHSRERRSPALTTACCQTARVDWLATAGRNRCTAVIRRRRATLQRIGLPAFPPPLDRPKAAVVAASSSTSCLLRPGWQRSTTDQSRRVVRSATRPKLRVLQGEGESARVWQLSPCLTPRAAQPHRTVHHRHPAALGRVSASPRQARFARRGATVPQPPEVRHDVG